MEDLLKIYWEVFAQKMSTEKIIRQTSNPLRGYEDEFIEGAIIDIGCGQSNFLLDYANQDRNIYAIDNDEAQLGYLKERVAAISTTELKTWQFIKLSFPEDRLPADSYSVIILSNFLHFFTLTGCKKIEQVLSDTSQKGTLIFVAVHSYNHYRNNPKDPDNNDYFKHYFKVQDFPKIFPRYKYELVYQSEIEKTNSHLENEIINECLDKVCEKEGITGESKDQAKKDYLKNIGHSEIQIILRRK